MKHLYLLALLVVFSLGIRALAVEPRVIVEAGGGHLQLRVEGLALSAEQVKRLETELLTSSELANLVTAAGMVQITLEGPALRSLNERLEQVQEKSAQELRDLIVVQAQSQRPIPTPAPTPSAPTQQQDLDADHVAVGSEVVVEAGEKREELVVIGGTVDVYGEVKRLLIIAGVGRIHEGARITEELTSISSDLEVDAGAEILGERKELTLPFTPEAWQKFEDQFRQSPLAPYWDNTWTRFAWTFLKLLVLMTLAHFGYQFAPGFQDRAQKYLRTHWVRSFFWSWLSAILVLPISMVLIFSIVGIPLLPVQFVLMCLLLAYGYIHAGQLLGSKMAAVSRGPLWLVVLAGLIFLELIGLIPVVGMPLKWVLILMGFGAASKVFYSRLLTR